jgi:hypothetical protein
MIWRRTTPRRGCGLFEPNQTEELSMQPMKATDFEYRRQLLLHELIVGAALLTYLVDRDNIVWRYIKSSDHAILLEHWLFAITTLLFGLSACLCTIARAHPSTEGVSGSSQAVNREFPRSLYQLRLFGDFLYALALASLLPLSGFFILIVCEAIRLVRLFWRESVLTRSETAEIDRPLTAPTSTLSAQTNPTGRPQLEWGKAFRREALKWGLLLTMIVFTLILKDRIAEILIGASVVLWILLNLRLSAVRSCLRVCLADRHA